MKHCIEVVEKSDIVILLINTKSGEEPELRWGECNTYILGIPRSLEKEEAHIGFRKSGYQKEVL